MSENAKRPAGRPTKYKEEFVDKVDEYIASCVDTVERFVKTEGEKSTSYERIVNVKLPMIEEFASYIGVHKDTVNEWRKIYPIFSVALDKITEEQKRRLIREGLAGNYNSAIAKLVLAANHDMRDKSDITTNGKDMPTPIAKLD